MAIYHFTVKNILRSEGKSATAAAAYRATEKIEDSYTGMTHDYTRKGWCMHREILLPENAPPEYADRETLWNAVEWAEDSPRGRVAREIEFSLPKELPREKQIELAREYIRKTFVDEDMIADWVIHNPPVRDDSSRPVNADGNPTNDPGEMIFRNPHVHCMLTVRTLDRKGRWAPKMQKEYVCRRGDEEKPMTAAEYKAAREDGWEKEYRYVLDGKKVWMTTTEAESHGMEVFDRVFRNPRSTLRGRENPISARWNSPETLKEWRVSWADAVNNGDDDTRGYTRQ